MIRIAAICTALLIILAVPPVNLFADESRPSWCREGWVCVRAAEMTEDTIYKINLREELAIAQARNRRTGWDLGCGVGFAVVVDVNYGVSVPPAGICGVTFAFWRFGK